MDNAQAEIVKENVNRESQNVRKKSNPLIVVILSENINERLLQLSGISSLDIQNLTNIRWLLYQKVCIENNNGVQILNIDY